MDGTCFTKDRYYLAEKMIKLRMGIIIAKEGKYGIEPKEQNQGANGTLPNKEIIAMNLNKKLRMEIIITKLRN